jgi:cation diffusion facilitator family transporter
MQHEHAHRGGVFGVLFHLFKPHSHDAADSADDALASSAKGIRALKVSLAALAATAIFQLVIALFSGSVALLADTVHNFSDALTAVPLWIAFGLSRRLPTRRYPHGFHRSEDLAGLLIVLVILLSACIAAYESIRRLLDPEPVSDLAWVAAAALIGFAGNEFVAIYRIRVGRQIGSAALVADGYHARTDGLTSLAVLLGVIGVALGFPLADPIVGLVITLAILVVLKQAVGQVLHRIMDGVEPGLVDQIEARARTVPDVMAVKDCRARWAGRGLLAELAIAVDGELSVVEAHVIASQVEHSLRHAIAKLRSVSVRVEPATRQVGITGRRGQDNRGACSQERLSRRRGLR